VRCSAADGRLIALARITTRPREQGGGRATYIAFAATSGVQGVGIPIDTELDTAQVQLDELPLDVPPQPGPLPEGSRALPVHNPLLSGRDADLARLAAALRGARTVVVMGPEGVGKTQLAAEFGHRFGRYFHGGVFWLSFGIPQEVSLQVAACGEAGAMGLRADFTDLALDDQLHLVLRTWQAGTPRLLIYDDCDDEDLLREWLPASGGAHVLVTSRRLSLDVALRVATMYLEPLRREESVGLLRRFRPDLPERAPALGHLADELEGLPLALRMAGGFLHQYRGQISLDSFLEQLRSRDVLERAAVLVDEDDGATQHGAASSGKGRARFGRRRSQQIAPAARVFAVVERWLERAEPPGQPALAIVSRAARFAPAEAIPRKVLLDAAGDPTGEAALGRLLVLGLLEASGEALVRLHRQVAKLVRASRSDPAAEIAAGEATIAWARAANDDGESGARMLALPHLDVITRSALARAQDDRAAALCFELGRSLWASGDLRRARVSLERALGIRERLFGRSDQRTIATLSRLGSLLQAQGDLAGAQAVLERALTLAEATLGREHAETALILTSLAWTLRYQGDLAGARARLERALHVSHRALGQDHPDTVGRLDGLGMLLREQGDLVGARAYCERALGILVGTLGPDHPRTLAAINNVGMLLREQGELAAARPYLEHALHASEPMLGQDHPDTATALDNMGTLLQAEGDLEGAKAHIERALAIRERTLGPDNPATGTSYNHLGMLLREQGDLEGARPHLEQALIISQRVLGPYDPQTATSYNNVGMLLLDLGDLYGAQPHLERALAIRDQGLGAEHPETATSLANAGALHVAYGDLAGARAYLLRALEIREKVLGTVHALTASSLYDLGRLLRGLGDREGARQYFERAVAVREQVLGPDHPDTLASMNDLDQLDRELGGGRRPAWPQQAPIEETPFFEN
jgi:tetratricopeptide (TPR) repeat protein